MLQNVFHIIFLILLLLTKAILNTLGDKTEIQPPDNYSVRELEMRKKCSEPRFIFLTLPSSSHRGYEVQFSWKSSLSSCLLHGKHTQTCIWEPLHQQSQATVIGNFLQGSGDLFTFPVLILSCELILSQPYLSRYTKITSVSFRISQ